MAVMAIRTAGPDKLSLSLLLILRAMKAARFKLLIFAGKIKDFYMQSLISCIWLFIFTGMTGYAQPVLTEQDRIITGAQRTADYFEILAGRSVGVTCNHTSLIGATHLVDTLLSAGIDVKRIFSPEHGFRGDAGAGVEVKSSTDKKTGIPIVSLYETKKKPDPGDLAGIEVMIFDIQDVGVRFYTYISTLTMVMEACAEQRIPLVLLDRPNPNALYIDGPVLDTNFRSFVGMHPVPIVYGMTIGEYATMVDGEGWLNGGVKCNLTVIPLQNWTRDMIVRLPVAPSPNLPNWQSVYLYPFLCLFEGTVVSVGRGTDFPFQVIGHPKNVTGSFAFVPRKIPGVAENPPWLGRECFGQSLTGYAESYASSTDPFTLFHLITYYKTLTEVNPGEPFFNNYFEKLAGNDILRGQIESGLPEDEIRRSWGDGISAFMKIREKYLLYPDNLKH
jgi:uncharacterized protein YbbC (DUF1343 family)